jgi:hypothetical protein
VTTVVDVVGVSEVSELVAVVELVELVEPPVGSGSFAPGVQPASTARLASRVGGMDRIGGNLS